MDKKTFYITTAIAYASKKPHLGNTYDVVLADAIARYKRMHGFDVFFMTGSDEHGQKIEEYAAAENISPKDYVDAMAVEIKASWDCLNTSYDKFIRTTDEDHVKVIQKIFIKLFDQGDIYKGEYEGKYCVPCESFFTEAALKDGKCPDCGREVTDAKEEAYFLRLNKYASRLTEHYEQNPDFIVPESRKREMVNNFLKPGLEDLCVSRTSFKWGVPVDFDPGHVVYVWIDALSNYITGIGYDPDGSSEAYKKYWPCDLHVIGKDIVRFHTIYWPVILMALGEPLPGQVLGHPWLLFGDDKMSKSKGNIIYADEMTAKYGADAVRYYLLSQIPFAQDGKITDEDFTSVYNTDLANILGNLVNRTVAMAGKYFGGVVNKPGSYNTLDKEIIFTAEECACEYKKLMDSYHNAEAAAQLINLARRLNKYIDETSPWVLAKDESKKDELQKVLYVLLEGIRMLGVFFTPFMPGTAGKILYQAGTAEDLKTLESAEKFGVAEKFETKEPAPLFARIKEE